MTQAQVVTANFGRSKADLTGSSGVGYTLYGPDGSVAAARSTDGVHQLGAGTGLYGASVAFADQFNGSVVWDTGEAGSALTFAVEQYNTEANDGRTRSTLQALTGSVAAVKAAVDVAAADVDFLKSIEGGRWRIDGTQMLFYKPDNSTLVATFDLLDASGSPNATDVFERRRA